MVVAWRRGGPSKEKKKTARGWEAGGEEGGPGIGGLVLRGSGGGWTGEQCVGRGVE